MAMSPKVRKVVSIAAVTMTVLIFAAMCLGAIVDNFDGADANAKATGEITEQTSYRSGHSSVDGCKYVFEVDGERYHGYDECSHDDNPVGKKVDVYYNEMDVSTNQLVNTTDGDARFSSVALVGFMLLAVLAMVGMGIWMKKLKCNHSGCDEPAVDSGFCRNHLADKRKVNQKICIEEGCEKRAVRRLRCNEHYEEYERSKAAAQRKPGPASPR